MRRPDPEAVRVPAGRHASRARQPPRGGASRTARPGRPPSARPPAASTSRASSRRASSRAGSRFGRLHLRASRSCAIAPHGPACSTSWPFVSTSRRCSAATARSTCLLRQPGHVAELRAGQRALVGDGADDRLLVGLQLGRLGGGDEQGSSRGATQVATRARCLPTQTRPCPGSSSLAPQRKPISSVQRTNVPSGSRIDQLSAGDAVHLLPERGQHDVRLREEQRQADLVDPARPQPRACALIRLQACRP